MLHTHKTLGTLVSMRVWHDNTGESPSWFLSRVAVKQLEANDGYDGEQWFFEVNDWLAVEYGDGKVQNRLINVSYEKGSSVVSG